MWSIVHLSWLPGIRGRRASFLVARAVLLCISISACAAQNSSTPVRPPTQTEKIRIPGIREAGKINDFLYRGAQPSDEGIRQLKKLGIDTIVDLRGERRGVMERERKRAEALGMKLVNVPGNGWSPPSDKEVAQFFSLIRKEPPRHIFVHCWLGSDRTGVFIAIYRIAFDGWTPQQALAEMHAFHFKGFFHPAMKSYVRDFPSRLNRSPELAAFRK